MAEPMTAPSRPVAQFLTAVGILLLVVLPDVLARSYRRDKP